MDAFDDGDTTDPGERDHHAEAGAGADPNAGGDPADPAAGGDFDNWTLDDAFISEALFSEPPAFVRSELNRVTEIADSAPGPYGFGSDRDRDGFASVYDGVADGFVSYTDIATGYGDHSDHEDRLIEQSLRRRRRRGRIVRSLAIIVVLATFGAYGVDYLVTGLKIRSWSDVMRAITGNEPPDGSRAGGLADGGTGDPTSDAGDSEDQSVPADDAADTAIGLSPDDRKIRIVRGKDWPPAPDPASNERVLPVVTTDATGTHKFIRLQPDGSRPVAYDPCRPIRYVISGAANAPLEGQALIEEAIAQVSSMTGLAFISAGTTDEQPSDTRPAFQPERYGDVWAPVLIAWSTPQQAPRLAETTEDLTRGFTTDVLGYAGSMAVGLKTTSNDADARNDTPRNNAAQTTANQTKGNQTRAARNGTSRYGTLRNDVSPNGTTRSDVSPNGTTRNGLIFVTGSVVLDGPDFASLLQTKGGYELARATLMHELGHLVGLDHVDDTNQLMYPSVQPWVSGFGGGDIQGLAALGAGFCMPDV